MSDRIALAASIVLVCFVAGIGPTVFNVVVVSALVLIPELFERKK